MNKFLCLALILIVGQLVLIEAKSTKVRNPINGTCLKKGDCLKDLGLKCISSTCQCKPGSTWNTALNFCALPLNSKCDPNDNSASADLSASLEENEDRCDRSLNLTCDPVSERCVLKA